MVIFDLLEINHIPRKYQPKEFALLVSDLRLLGEKSLEGCIEKEVFPAGKAFRLRIPSLTEMKIAHNEKGARFVGR